VVDRGTPTELRDSPVTIANGRASVTFDRYDLDAYRLFLRAKQLPEKEIAYDWATDSYTLTTSARFAGFLQDGAVVTAGTDVALAEHLFDYQAFIVRQALDARRYAIWADTGLGKTAMLLEWARQVRDLTGGRVLILAPTHELIDQHRDEWERFYPGEVSIPKNPQVIAQRQKLHSLLFITGRRNARDLAPAVNDFLLIFQKPGEAEPVKALRHEENPAGWVTGDEWIRWARGTWDDIRETDVLEGWKDVRDTDDEKHVCPLQLEVIRRCVKLYSSPGDLVLDPFMGIGSTAYVALEQGRQAVGFELKESYHRQAVKNAALALERDPEGQTSLLDLPEAV
jgi:hypothetical protein